MILHQPSREEMQKLTEKSKNKDGTAINFI